MFRNLYIRNIISIFLAFMLDGINLNISKASIHSNFLPQKKLEIGISSVDLHKLSKESINLEPSAIEPGRFHMKMIASGLDQPLAIVNSGDGLGRLFVVERSGIIRIIESGGVLDTPFLDLSSIVLSSSSEQGLLSLVFHPQFGTNGFLYTLHIASDNSIVISRFTVSPPSSNQVDFDSRAEILLIPHPGYTNHNGGSLVFGQDGYLYISIGDGGGGGDPNNNAQNLNTLLGKILRLDVDSAFPYAIPNTNPYTGNANSKPEIWAYGLRNPWRISFDRLTNDLYIGDVGQSNREEINFQESGSKGGENYGWKIMEGSLCYNAATCNQNSLVLPVAEYSHTSGCSVTGGYVYRGTQYPSLQGHYLYADYCTGMFFNLYQTQTNGWSYSQILDTPYGVSTFGEDEEGELYFADYFQGMIYQITYSEATFGDVSEDHPYYQDIEILYANGLTAGCSTESLLFCPDMTMNRAQSAVFMVRSNFGHAYSPPPAPWMTFDDDFSPGPWAQPWAQGMFDAGLTAGCSTTPMLFCPWEEMPRLQAAVFGLRLRYGTSYPPPAGTGTIFADINGSEWYAGWVEQAYANGLLPACGTEAGKPIFCPNNLVSRGLAAYMIVRAKNLSIP